MHRIFLIIISCLLGSQVYSQSLNLDSVSRFTYNSGTSLNDIWGYVDSSGTEYALVGKTNGLSVVSLADTNNLVEIYGEQSVYSIWRDIKTWGDYAYVTNESSGGLAIYDLSTLPDSVGGVTYFTGVNYSINTAHNIYIDENGVAYLFGSNNSTGSFGTVMLDVATNPGQPIELGYFDSLYLHDGYARGDTLYGSAVYAGQLLVIDVSDKLNPRIIGSASTPNNFTHNSWPSDDGKTIFTTDEVADGFIGAYDVSNPSAIFQTDRIRTRASRGVIPHNAHVLNDFVITSYYTWGVSIVDGNKPDNLVEVGYYDTSPAYTGGTFNGNWGAYPYFPSGLLILSDIEEGLYVMRPSYKRASYLEGRVEDCSGSAISQADVKIIGELRTDKTNLNGFYKTGSPQDGYRTVEVNAPGFYKQVFDSVLFVSGRVTSFNPQLIRDGNGLNLNTMDVSNPIVSATVQFLNADTSLSITSDPSGNILVPEIQFGEYTLTGGKWGYEPLCNQRFDFNCSTKDDTILLVQGYKDNFNQDFGWQVTGNETVGNWVREIPFGTVHNIYVANPGVDENTDCGNFAYFTGIGLGNPASSDVDSTAVLTSPQLDFSNYVNPYINFYSWFYNEGNIGNDAMIISFIDSANNEIFVDSISEVNQTIDWDLRSYRVADFVSLTSLKAVRFSVEDQAPDHILEAGIDNFFVSEGIFIGIEDKLETVSEFSVYPNPFRDEITIELGALNLSNRIQIFDIHGRMVYSTNTNKSITRVQTNNFKNGIYFVIVENEKGEIQTQKIVK